MRWEAEGEEERTQENTSKQRITEQKHTKLKANRK
jgi:hypothetical protein